LSEAEFRVTLGIYPVTSDADAFGEFFKPVCGWPGFDASNLARVRTSGRSWDGEGPATPPRIIKRKLTPDGWMVPLNDHGQRVLVPIDYVLSRALGPGWEVPPIPDPDPPGVAWREVPEWPAYEISRCGLVRSYHVHRGALAEEPQRLLRPLWDALSQRAFVALCDGAGRHEQIPIERLVRWAWGGRLAPALGPVMIKRYWEVLNGQDQTALAL